MIRRWGQARPSTWTGHNYLALYACWQAGENFQLAGALEDCQRSIGKCPAPCFLVLYTVADVTLIAHGIQCRAARSRKPRNTKPDTNIPP